MLQAPTGQKSRLDREESEGRLALEAIAAWQTESVDLISELPVAALGPATAARPVTLNINGADRCIELEPRVTLLDALREQLGLTGTKKGCDHGQCGACTVHVGGRRVLACLTLAAAVEGSAVRTIEGLATAGELHPMQAAFVACDALQCGYCTPGQIMSALGCVDEGRTGSDAEIAESMSGNLCRCGAYPNIREAIRHAAD